MEAQASGNYSAPTDLFIKAWRSRWRHPSTSPGVEERRVSSNYLGERHV